MCQLQFWNSTINYKNINIETFYLAEKKLWLFNAVDIYHIFDVINNNLGLLRKQLEYLQRPKVLQQIRLFKNNQWKDVDVIDGKSVIEAVDDSSFEEVKSFEAFIMNICEKVPEGCFLSKDSTEYEFLQLATNRFLDLYKEINNDAFFSLSDEIRYYKIKDCFSVYSELISYPNIREHIEFINNSRPPMEAVISNEFVKFVRNVLIHFPCFTKWDDIYISKRLVNWKSEGQSIDKFLTKYQGYEPVQYRFKERLSGKWRYPVINFPRKYENNKIFLKDMIDERDGILLCAVLMFKVVASQIIDIEDRE